MNKKQRIVIIIGIILVLICGLFPPYEGKKSGELPLPEKEEAIGYYFLFSHPSSEEISKEIYENYKFLNNDEMGTGEKLGFSASIMMSKYLIQIITIVLITTGLIFYFAKDPTDYDKTTD